ncbi:hypothetical protein RP20_CCG017441 [Aedes albopictus]|nr:hypothetical protein RP20_CCG017441 [Aedes albopictus]
MEHTEKPKNPQNTRKNGTTTTEDAAEAVPVKSGLRNSSLSQLALDRLAPGFKPSFAFHNEPEV